MYDSMEELPLIKYIEVRSSNTYLHVLIMCYDTRYFCAPGLARTCEIFGVSELVLSNIKVLEEKQFQSLSVTAERWLNITEVCAYVRTSVFCVSVYYVCMRVCPCVCVCLLYVTGESLPPLPLPHSWPLPFTTPTLKALM